MHRFASASAVALVVVLFAVPLPAQTILSTDDFGYSGAHCGRNIVRDSNGDLYLATIEQTPAGTRPIRIHQSVDDGNTWTLFLATGINDSTGASFTVPTGCVSVAIDDQDRLHLIWGSFSSSQNFFRSFYRNYELATGTFGAVVDIKAAFGGIPNSARTTACNVAVGPDNSVWITAPTTSNWRTQLAKSNVPYAAGNTFTSVGVVTASGASAQTVRLAIDAVGNAHCTYYQNTGSGDYLHRMYDDVAGSWSTDMHLGNLSPTNDYHGAIACDLLGNTHILAHLDAFGTGAPEIRYFVRDVTGAFSPPLTVASFTNAQFTGNNQYTVALTCDEATGDAYVVYRDHAGGGRVVLEKKGLTDTAFSQVLEVLPPNSAQHHYYAPRLAGSLWPATNNFNGTIQLTVREQWPAPYVNWHFAVPANVGQPSTVSFSPAPTVAPGTSVLVDFAAPSHPGEVYIPIISCTPGTTPIQNGFALPVVQDFCFNWYFLVNGSLLVFILGDPGSFFGTLDASGCATGVIAMPAAIPAGLNIPIHVCFITSVGGNVTGVSQIGTVTLI